MNWDSVKNATFKAGRIAGASGSLVVVSTVTTALAGATVLLAKEAITGRFENLVAAIRS